MVAKKELPVEKSAVPTGVPTKKLKYKVVSIGDYLPKAREQFGPDNAWDNALALLYSENEVVAIVNKKGEDRFLVKE